MRFSGVVWEDCTVPQIVSMDAKAWIDDMRPRRPMNKPEPEGRSLISPEGELLDDQHRWDLGHLEFMRRRELGLGAPNKRTLEQREQYLELGMNETLYDVPCEFSFAKRFSPCGKVYECDIVVLLNT